MLLTRPLPDHFDLLLLQRVAPSRYPLLMESVASGTAHGRWDLLLMGNGQGLCLDRQGVTRTLQGQVLEGAFLELLDAQWRPLRVLREQSRWPFHGGWALMLGYELAGQVEPVLQLPQDADGMPIALALRCPAAALRDRATGQCIAITEPGHAGLLEVIAGDVQAGAALAAPVWSAPSALVEDDPQAFLDGVGRILQYLAAGDVFQVNLSRGWRARFDAPLDPAALYARLRHCNPAPFAGLFRHQGVAVVSASPERLVSVRDGIAQTRPIAGTRARLEGDEDAARIRELVGHPKERAEHVMLIDLERNDLGRVCTPGSVEVDELMTVESYAHVHHIVSNVRGQLRAEVTPGQVIAATFPGGTITGCPKVRCMQIIAELEQAARGAYTGAFGWLGRDGDLDLNILIRSARLVDEAGGSTLCLRTGAGIVIDSHPGAELAETRAKARGMLAALGPVAGA